MWGAILEVAKELEHVVLRSWALGPIFLFFFRLSF